MIKPFLILQLRPEDDAADGEFQAFLKAGGLDANQVRRVRMERDGVPEISLDDYSGVIVGGGPYNVSDESKPLEQQRFELELFDLLDEITRDDIPYLGACYGHGALAMALGGRVSKEKYAEEVSASVLTFTDAAATDPVATGLGSEFKAFLGHKEASQDVPPGAVLLATSAACPVQMIRFKRNIYGFQFHPESDPQTWATRISIYRHAGYFKPEEADMLMAAALKENVTAPVAMFKRFIDRYSESI